MRSKRQCKTRTIQLRKTATRTIKRHAVHRTVNRQSSGAILAELKQRLSEIYDLTAAGSVLTWDEACPSARIGTARNLLSRHQQGGALAHPHRR